MARDSITRAAQPILMDELAHYLFIDRRLTSALLTYLHTSFYSYIYFLIIFYTYTHLFGYSSLFHATISIFCSTNCKPNRCLVQRKLLQISS